jgi:hypothetical protein
VGSFVTLLATAVGSIVEFCPGAFM